MVARNLGRTDEAVRQVWLEFAGTLRTHPAVAEGPVAFQDDKPPRDLPPRKEVRRTYDLLDEMFMGAFPAEVTAIVVLESGERVSSAPLALSSEMLKLVEEGER